MANLQRSMYMRNAITQTFTNKFFGQLWEDLLGYLRIYDYIKLKTRRALNKTAKIPSIGAFWYSVLGDRFARPGAYQYTSLRDGDVIRLKDVFLSEWAPKLPGQLWTLDGVADFHTGRDRIVRYEQFDDKDGKIYAVLDPWGKSRVISAGFGSVRVNKSMGTKDAYAYMAFVDMENWHCDYGIPVIVSRQVYDLFMEHSEKGAPWIQSVEGILHTEEDIPFRELIPCAIGSKLSAESEATLRYRPGLPKCFVHVVSPLSIRFRYNDSHPEATAWTMFETNLPAEPYRYTYSTFQPKDKRSIDDAVEFIRWYAETFDGRKIITDFDGSIPRLDAFIPLTSDPMQRRQRIRSLIKNCNSWVAIIQERHRREWG
jgi:hypothetical protein